MSEPKHLGELSVRVLLFLRHVLAAKNLFVINNETYTLLENLGLIRIVTLSLRRKPRPLVISVYPTEKLIELSEDLDILIRLHEESEDDGGLG